MTLAEIEQKLEAIKNRRYDATQQYRAEMRAIDLAEEKLIRKRNELEAAA